MAITELVEAMRRQAIEQRQHESELLKAIAMLSDIDTAEAAATRYDARKHGYSFDGYLYQLEKLRAVLAAGVPAEAGIECVDSCIDTQIIIDAYNMAQGGFKR